MTFQSVLAKFGKSALLSVFIQNQNSGLKRYVAHLVYYLPVKMALNMACGQCGCKIFKLNQIDM